MEGVGRFKIKYKILLFLFFSFSIFNACFSSEIDTLLTPEEINWLKENKDQIRYAPNPSWAPIDYIDGKGVHQGIVSDYISIFQDKLKEKFIKVSFSDWSELLRGLYYSKVDFVGAIQKSPEREKFLSFTDSYLNIPVVIIIRNDYSESISRDDINNMKLAGVRDYASTEYVKAIYQNSKVIEFKDDLSALMQTSLGNTDGTIIDLMTASYLVEKYGITNLAPGVTLDYNWNISFASSKKNPILNSILNKLLNSIDEDQKKKIYSKWVNFDKFRTENFFERNYKSLIYISIIVLMLLIFIIIYNYLLKKQVRERTIDLKREVIEKAKALEKVKESEKNYRTLFDHSVLPKWICDLNNLNIIEVDQTAVDHYGYSREEFLNMSLNNIFYDKNFLNLLFEKSMQAKGTIFFGICKHKKKDNELIDVEVYGNAISYNDMSCVIISCSDVTKKLKVFEALKSSIERYKYVTKATFDAIWDMDFVNKKLFWGEGFAILFGNKIRDNKTNYKNWKDYVHPDDRQRILESLNIAINSGEDNWTESYRYLKSTGEYAFVKDKAILIRNNKKEVIRMIGAVQDITAQKRYIKSIEGQNTQLREIAWMQSHIVRAPLARIMGLIDLLQNYQDMDLSIDDVLKLIVESAHELDKIIREITVKTINNEVGN